MPQRSREILMLLLEFNPFTQGLAALTSLRHAKPMPILTKSKSAEQVSRLLHGARYRAISTTCGGLSLVTDDNTGEEIHLSTRTGIYYSDFLIEAREMRTEGSVVPDGRFAYT